MAYSKYVLAGNFLEIYDYPFNKVQSKRRSNFFDFNKSNVGPDEQKTEMSYRSAKTRIRRLINCNFKYGRSSFLTLTYAENMGDVEKAKLDFKNWILRLNYALYEKKTSDLKYLAVYELQQRGAIHFHVVLFDVPWIEINKMRDIWGFGFIKYNKLKNCDNVGAYICKYFTKDGSRKKNEKLFFRSFNLKEPHEIELDEDASKLYMAGFNVLGFRYAKEYKDYFGSNIYYRQLMVEEKIDTS
ncbi:MAG: hypothetical protein AAB797_03805 [Patescibacteria group bacterium]